MEEKKECMRILIEVLPGRWGRVFHIFDNDGREIALQQKDAVLLARQILKEVKN
jgi:hypothetical protein